MDISTVSEPPHATESNSAYWNRPPLMPNAFAKLPLGAIKPRGWLKNQLDLMADGMVGRLPELSNFLKEDNGWFGTENQGWEEQPYWLRGFYDLAVLTDREDLYNEASRWIENVLASQDEDGYFGAQMHKNIPGKDPNIQTSDLWPHMVMLDALRHHWEYTGDTRVPALAKKFFAFCQKIPDAEFIPHQHNLFEWKVHVQAKRAGDMMPHLYWLFNQTGDHELLQLADRFYQRIRPAEDEWLDHHIVHFTQRFAYPGIYYQQSGQKWHLRQTDYWYRQHLNTWGQQPGGIFGADEKIVPGSGKTDPRQGFETCGFTEFAKNFYMLGRVTGNPVYADRCEELILNHFPASQTPEYKGLHYLTASNCPQLDNSPAHDFWNEKKKGFPQLPFSPYNVFRCCQHNVAMGWPWYVQNLWQASSDNGLATWLYGPCEVTTKVGKEGRTATVETETDYPFDTQVHLRLHLEEAVSFPLYLRIPRWCDGFKVRINGEEIQASPQPGQFLRIEREWHPCDQIDIDMPPRVGITEWPRNGSMTVHRGPLHYSVKIREDWRKCGGDDKWPEWEVFPATPWNYGLAIDRENPEKDIEVTDQKPASDQPWTPDTAPVILRAKGRKIPGWTLGEDQMVPPLMQSPVHSSEPEETIDLIPMGCARLRMACLPEVKSAFPTDG